MKMFIRRGETLTLDGDIKVNIKNVWSDKILVRINAPDHISISRDSSKNIIKEASGQVNESARDGALSKEGIL